MAVKRLLTNAGYACDVAGNGAEALSLCRVICYDLVLMDVHMPVMDGKEATLAIRKVEENGAHHVVIVGISAKADDERGCVAATMDGFLTKPLVRGALLEKVAKWTGQGAGLAQLAGAETAGGAASAAEPSAGASRELGPMLAAGAPAPSSAPGGPPRPAHRVLLAEDNLMNQVVMKRMLAVVGCAVTLVMDGQAAVDAVAAGGVFDLVLMDLNMPVMGGIEATAAIRALPLPPALQPLPPVIGLTAGLSDEEGVRWRQAGVAQICSKPLTMQAIKDVCARWGGATLRQRTSAAEALAGLSASSLASPAASLPAQPEARPSASSSRKDDPRDVGGSSGRGQRPPRFGHRDSFTFMTLAAPSPSEAAAAAMAPRRGPPLRARILIAEDDRTSQIMIRRLVEMEGHTVAVACNGAEAVAMAAAAGGGPRGGGSGGASSGEGFACILMDCHMPVRRNPHPPRVAPGALAANVCLLGFAIHVGFEDSVESAALLMRSLPPSHPTAPVRRS